MLPQVTWALETFMMEINNSNTLTLMWLSLLWCTTVFILCVYFNYVTLGLHILIFVSLTGATAARDHSVPVLRAGPGWEGWSCQHHKPHFSRGRPPKDQPGAGEAPSERWRRRRRHAVRLLGLFVGPWHNWERAPDLPWIREWLLWRWSADTTEAKKRSPGQ